MLIAQYFVLDNENDIITLMTPPSPPPPLSFKGILQLYKMLESLFKI